MKDFYPFNSATAVLIDGTEAVTRNKSMGHLCGYTMFNKSEIPEGWAGNYDADALQYLGIHGGLTYAHVHGDECVFGFDCIHAGDEDNEKLREAAHVLALAKEMRQQILLYAARFEEWKAADKDRRIAIIEEIRKPVESHELGFGALIDVMSGGKAFEK